MEDEQGEVGPGSVEGVSESPLSGKLPSESETLVENLGGENRVEESYEEGEEGEIMVEIVGSDVFVDGVGGHEEGDVVSEEVKDLEGREWENQEEIGTQDVSQAVDVSSDEQNDVVEKREEIGDRDISGVMDASSEGDGNKVGESEVGLSGSRDEQSDVLEKREEIETPKVLEAVGVSSDGGENKVRDEQSDVLENREEIETPKVLEALDASSEGDGNKVGENEEGFSGSRDEQNDVVENREETGAQDVSEQKDVLENKEEIGARDVSEAMVVSSEGDNKVGESKVELSGSKDEQNDVLENIEKIGTENVSEAMDVSGEGDDKNDAVTETVDVSESIDVEGGGVGVLNDEGWNPGIEAVVVSTEEVLEKNPEEKAIKDETVDKDTPIVEEKVDTTEKEEVVPSSDNVLPSEGPNFVRVDGMDNVVAGGEVLATASSEEAKFAEIVDEKEVLDAEENKGSVLESDAPVVSDDVQNENQGLVNEFHPVEATVVEENVEKDKILPSSDNNAVANSEILDEKVLHAGEKDEKALISDVRDVVSHATQESPHGEVTGMEIDEVRDVKDTSMPDSSCVSSDEPSKIDENLKTEMSPPTQLADTGDAAEVKEDEGLGFEIQVDTDEIEEVKVVDGIVSSEKVEEIISEIPNAEIETLDDTSTEKVETTDIGMTEEVLAEITETPNLESDNFVNTNLIPNEDVNNDVAISMDEINSNGYSIVEEEKREESDEKHHGGPEIEYVGPELGPEEPVTYSRMDQSGYLLPPENEGHFAVSDLVWGKVRSHPWWPGQIFDSSEASEKALKHYKKDSYLVAYFGDRTFAWNDSSVLKPFRSHFSQIENKQSNSEAFQNAVNEALDEVSRRVELGLACSCVPKDSLIEIEAQVVENTGIREESSRRYGVDRSTRADSFEPVKLLDFVRHLAVNYSSARADRLDLVIARAQLSAFCRFKGYRLPAGFPLSARVLVENDEVVVSTSNKRKHAMKDNNPEHSRKKERSLMDIMGGDEEYYIPDAEENESDKTGTVKITTPKNQETTPKPSFKIGECISRVASKLTGSTPIVKETIVDNSSGFSSLNEMLSQLEIIARDPKNGREKFPNTTKNFLTGFRNSVSLSKRARKRKADSTAGEEFEFDDVNDSYWTDRIVHNYPDEHHNNNNNNTSNGPGNLQVVAFEQSSEKPVKPNRRPYSRKRFSTGSFPTEATEFEEKAKRKKQETSPAELILNFADRNCVPSEINLNKMFRRFGPLMESETEVDHSSGRAKVIFKRGSDAEVAHSSAERFSIFGPVLVNYQIGYTPLISVKISSLAVPQFQEDSSLML